MGEDMHERRNREGAGVADGGLLQGLVAVAPESQEEETQVQGT